MHIQLCVKGEQPDQRQSHFNACHFIFVKNEKVKYDKNTFQD